MGATKNLGVDHFPDPVGHFEAPWWPFWGSHRRNDWIKKLILRKLSEGSNKLRLDLFRTPSAILDKAGGEVLKAVRHCRRWVSALGTARLIFVQVSFAVMPFVHGSNILAARPNFDQTLGPWLFSYLNFFTTNMFLDENFFEPNFFYQKSFSTK